MLLLFLYFIGDVPTQVVVFICSHYFLRKACEAKALFTVSPAVFRKYYTDMWTLFDVVAIILTLAATIWNGMGHEAKRSCLSACTTMY